jgi:thiamine biosynthesis lipoprotein ApbE
MYHSLLVPLTTGLILGGAVGSPAHAQETVERHLAAMGTHLGIEVTAPTRAAALAASEAAVRAIEAVEVRLSTWTDASELARLNAAPVGQPVALSPELAADLALAREVWRDTDGAFDPGVGALVRAFGLRDGGREPAAGELEAALAGGGFGSLHLDGRAATRLRAGLVLEEGGFGKGVGLEAALTALRDAGATAATVDLGGQTAMLPAADGAVAATQRFAVADPRDRAATVVEVALERGSLATSGNSERGIVVAGEPRSHLLDPRTGRPAADFGSVTVWTEDAAYADALSTALYVMGPDAGLEWAAARPGVEALYLVADGDGALTARATATWAARLEPAVAGLAIEPVGAPLASASAAARPAAPAAQQPAQDDDARITALEQQMDAFSFELERTMIGDLVPPLGDSYSGLGPAASKVYSKDQGLSIGGYGEALYRDPEGGGSATFDLLRAVFYFGYKFNEDWILNLEIEHEHADETFVEFAYVDYLGWEATNARGGLVLIPMGFLNELHEPTTFLPAVRSDTESKIIPSTWRENGVGVYGDAGPVEYRAYLVNGLDGSGFSDAGLRGGRQKGSQALADDLAVVGRVDYVDVPGLVVGGSAYVGDSGQSQAGIGEVGTLIYEVHGEWRQSGLWLRALAAIAELDDVDQLNAGLGLAGADSVGERLEGFYAECGYDVMQVIDPAAELEVSPYVRWEAIDTQAEVPSGFTSDPANDEEILTFGVHVSPIPQLVFKAELQDRDQGADSFNFGMGWVF